MNGLFVSIQIVGGAKAVLALAVRDVTVKRLSVALLVFTRVESCKIGSARNGKGSHTSVQIAS